MIQPLRNWHRWTFEVLGILLPIVFLAGLAARPSGTKSTSLPPALSGQKIFETASAWKNHSITTTLFTDGPAVLLQLEPAARLVSPDLLLYWSSEPAPTADGIESNATLLGSFEPGRRYLLPREAKRGRLLLYSLAHRKLVDSAVLQVEP